MPDQLRQIFHRLSDTAHVISINPVADKFINSVIGCSVHQTLIPKITVIKTACLPGMRKKGKSAFIGQVCRIQHFIFCGIVNLCPVNQDIITEIRQFPKLRREPVIQPSRSRHGNDTLFYRSFHCTKILLRDLFPAVEKGVVQIKCYQANIPFLFVFQVQSLLFLPVLSAKTK